MRSDVLVAEISGKRPGTSKERPTERFQISYDHLIISNNSDGYETDWDIVMVPDEYREWYCEHYKTSDNAWYAPMNRSYAIKYAREHGYKYLIQMDDNITFIEIGLLFQGDIQRRYRRQDRDGVSGMMDDFIDMLVTVLENTNAGMTGCDMCGVSQPDSRYFLRERYCYSLFALDLNRCPDVFQGDFEDDIEFRLKMKQMGIPAVQIPPLRYSKTGQVSNKDETGNRAAYTAVGVKRGEHMRKLYGDLYSCGMRSKTNGITSEKVVGTAYFKHKLVPWKVGVIVKDRAAIDRKMKYMLEKYAPSTPDKYIIRKKKKAVIKWQDRE